MAVDKDDRNGIYEEIGSLKSSVRNHEGAIGRIADKVSRLDEKLDQLTIAMTISKSVNEGTWWAITKVAAVVVFILGAAAWLLDHFWRITPR